MPVLYASLNSPLSPKAVTDSGSPKVSDAPNQSQHTWHVAIDKKHIFFHVKFEARFAISLSIKVMSNEKYHFFHGDGPCFSQKAAAFWFSNGFLSWRMP
jgi:hypothetical protein